MDTFFDWFTDPHNNVRIQNQKPITGQRQSEHKELCRLVNNKHNTSWTASQVKTKIAYVKRKYREAVALNSTGEGSVLHKQEAICPLFLRLHPVLVGGSLSTNPLPLRQSGSRGEDLVSADDSEEESSGLETSDDQSDTYTNAESHYFTEPKHPRKRQNTRGLASAYLQRSVDKMQQLANENMTELRAREQVIVNRERELSEKLLRLSDEANKRADEARVRLMQELAAERAEFKKEVASERAGIRGERAEIREERAEVRKERAEVRKERALLRQEKVDFDRVMAEFMEQREQLIEANSAFKTAIRFM